MPDFAQLIGVKTFEQLCQETFAALAAAGFPVTNLNVGGVFRTGTEAHLQAIADLYALLVRVVPQGFTTLATGTWLDLRAAELGLSRQPATRARGTIVFGRNITGEAVVIPAGTLVKTKMSDQGVEYRYRTLAEAIIPATQQEAVVEVEAESAGAAYNVASNAITQLVTHVPGVDYVVNRAEWLTSPGRDTETDDSLRNRCILRWNELAAGTKMAYVSWAKSNPDVLDVHVIENARGSGTVDVVIWSIAGNPSEQLIADVQEYIDARRPLTADVLVRRPVLVNFVVKMLLVVSPAATDSELAAAQAEAERRINAAMGIIHEPDIAHIAISQDVDRMMLIALARTVPKVINVILNSPAEDILVADGHRRT